MTGPAPRDLPDRQPLGLTELPYLCPVLHFDHQLPPWLGLSQDLGRRVKIWLPRWSQYSASVDTWLPVLRAVTPRGLRHGLQTWMDEDGIPVVFKTERMGHEMPGMHGVYWARVPSNARQPEGRLARALGDPGPLKSLAQPRSAVPALNKLLAAERKQR